MNAPTGVGLGALVSVLLPVLLLGTVGISAAGQTATDTVRSTIEEVIDILNDEAWKKPERLAERRALLERVIGRRFDYEEMAKRALAAHWPKLTCAKRKEFVALFAAFLSATYADKIESYSGETVEYLNERVSDGYAEVRTKIVSGKAEYPLDYRLLNRAGKWYVYDVIADGVSLVKNYRGQFDRTIRSSSFDDLVQTLRKKVEEAKAPKPAS
ncbi:MlaC/ttg2D family ABC transporter substrate-binding protein [Candidatus Nitrospira bockiana]